MLVKDKMSDMEVCLTVLYGFMLMKMKKRPISEDTAEAIETIRKLIALLSVKFKEFEEGLIEL
jgi:flagellin-specific chaperone FliS